MSFLDKVRGQFVDIVEFLDESRDTLVWRFPRQGNEIKMGARLVVREGQAAVFVNEGQVADVFGPGTYTLATQNLPVLSTLKGWKHGFNSPFKAEVYFVGTRQYTDFKWGTQNPFLMRDAEFGMLRIRARGTYALQVTDPVALLRELVGTDPQFRTEEVAEFLRQNVVAHVASTLAASGVAVLDMAANQLALGERLTEPISASLAEFGITLPRFVIENISLPPEVEEALDKRTQMGLLGDLGQYTRLQAANALEDAANNPGGAGQGAGLLMGMGLGQVATGALGGSQPGGSQASASEPAGAQAGATPPPLPAAAPWFVAVDGRQTGPHAVADLPAKVEDGTLTRESLVWQEGMDGWTAAGQVPQLAALFPTLPPPLPTDG